MGWSVWFIAMVLGALAIGLILHLIPSLCQLVRSFRAGFRGEPEYRLTPKQEALNERAIRKRELAQRQEEHKVWLWQYSNLQIQAHKARLEVQQEREKEN